MERQVSLETSTETILAENLVAKTGAGLVCQHLIIT